jgi:hypothetical protein
MTTVAAFQTPPRLLIPKLVRSRDAWKAKATARKAQRKALAIRVRDLEASRERHRRHAEQHRQRAEQLQERVAQLEAQLAATRQPAPIPPEPPQNAPGLAVDTMTSPSSTSP